MNQEIKVELLLSGKPTILSEKDIEVHYGGIEKYVTNKKYDNATGILSFGWEIDYDLHRDIIKGIIERFQIWYSNLRRDFTINLIMEEWEIYGLDNDNYMIFDDNGDAYDTIEDFKNDISNAPNESSLGSYHYTKLNNGDVYRFKAFKDGGYSLYNWVDFEKM